ncbi:hypothetical protein SAMN02982929_00965 [Saccharopolyspora kobensis]|uniref:SMODS-associated and fused to various effectors domain-containing protein n=1 Tax=Saccharopolyspora kobensis TaxID=146035 RepID=A0A1H5VRL8_9PSEU|nr:hypothetical protein [Saccharopolyspora kobensis]SEF89949.1 hypothetical protein SAMN02982929_00965 [Saccharopolyspora kobensis]SFC57754.1 hypothetical protein SAMN05216506_1011105 [Saccharopolyspora kobensis]
MKSLRRLVPGIGQLRVQGANWLIVTSTAVITAALALVVEDGFPKTPQDKPVIVPERLTVLVVALVVLILALLWRTYVHDKKGTLFYVQVLDESMANLHNEPLKAAREERLALRSVTRWVSLNGRRRNGVIDMVEACREIGHAVEDAINTDRNDTGYTIAPNIFWPMALAVGAHLPQPDKLKLLEFEARRKGSKRRAAEFPMDSPPSGLLRRDTHELAGSQGNRVGVWLALTDKAKFYSEEKFADFGVSTLHVITLGGKIPGRDGYEPDFDRDALASFGPEISRFLREIKRETADRELVVVAMVPKTVTLAIGWHLSQTRNAFFAGTHLMHYDQPSGGYIPMRVRESQPTTPPTATAPVASGNGHKKEATGASDNPDHP